MHVSVGIQNYIFKQWLTSYYLFLLSGMCGSRAILLGLLLSNMKVSGLIRWMTRGVWELKREGGLHPILSPTKMKVRQNSFDCLSFCSSSCLSASLSACLPVFLPVFLPFYMPYGMSCFLIFLFSYFLSFPPIPFFFLGDLQSDAIYCPTPGGSNRPPGFGQ